jgi:hypothetical protein
VTPSIYSLPFYSFSPLHFRIVLVLIILILSTVLSISGAPHVLTEEQVFERYFFPKGTVFIGNIWGIMHDEKYFSRPLEFLPERFLQRQSQTQSDSLDEKDRNSHPDARLDPWNYAFGFGRRSAYALYLPFSWYIL